MAPTDHSAIKNLVVNRRARHEFALDTPIEAGLALLGSEVKSLRAGRANLQEAWVRIDDAGEAWLVGCHISTYEQANRNNHEPLRERKLLLRRNEILRLQRDTRERGRTIVPLRLYLKGSRVKLEIAVGTGKKHHDKRASLKERDARREMERAR